MFHRRLIGFLAALVLAVCCCAPALAYKSTTLSNGSKGESVKTLQQALINLGYLKDTADGVFGNRTETAVRAFQAARGLTVDGLAGLKTQELLYAASSGTAASAGTETAAKTDSSSSSSAASSSSSSASSSSSGSASSSGGSLFSGNYATIRPGDRGDRVKALQQALISLNYLSGRADGIFGNKTETAVRAFQSAKGLTVDGLAGRKTLKALESGGSAQSASSSSSSASSSSSSSSSSAVSAETAANIQEETAAAKASTVSTGNSPSSSTTVSGPNGNSVQLLHWFNDIKKTLSGGQRLLIYDPATGISWTLRVHSCGRHCDAEPLTAEDTSNMLRAFGGVNTWDQKGVYVRLPSGVWTIGSTHDMPHMSGTISDNNFNGHLCVHFLRDMSEAEANDPKYGVANQKTIRELWQKLTGEVLDT